MAEAYQEEVSYPEILIVRKKLEGYALSNRTSQILDE